MSTSPAASAGSTRMLFRVGWWTLVVLFALVAVNHAAGTWFIASSTDEAQMFEHAAALNLFALVVLLIPYRRLEGWAWWAMWIAILPIGLVIAFGTDAIGVTYLITAIVLALAQFATLPRFRSE